MNEAYLEACRILAEYDDVDPETRSQRLAERDDLTDEVRAYLEELVAHDVDDDFLDETLAVPVEALRGVVDLPPPVIPRYEITRSIGAGGMGAVFLARQREPVRRDVAIKVMHLDLRVQLDPDRRRAALARFEIERQTLALMTHADVARILDGGTTPDGRPYLVMDFVPGTPITEFCRAHELDLDARLRLVLRVCAAVEHAHLKGIIHRDLKPSNVLAWMDENGPQVKVIDFGIAKLVDRPDGTPTVETRPGAVGTWEYMSPEQTGGAEGIDRRTDVYAMGCLLYELLVGRSPLRSRLESLPDHAKPRVIVDVDPERPSAALDTAPDGTTSMMGADGERMRRRLASELDWIVLKSLAKEPERRYPTAAALADDIERHLTGDAVEAAPPTRIYRFRKFARRNRGALAMTVVIAVSLVTATFISAAARARESAALEVANRQSARSTFLYSFMNGVLLAPKLGLMPAGDDVAPSRPRRDVAVLDALGEALPGIGAAFDLDARTGLELSVNVGEILVEYGAYDEARALLEAAREHRAASALDAPTLEAKLLRLLGRVETETARLDEGRATLVQAIELARAHDLDDEAARAALGLVENAFQRGSIDEARRTLDANRPALEGDPVLHATAEHFLGAIEYVSGDVDAGERRLLAAIYALQDRSEIDAQVELLAATADLGVMLQNAGRSEDALSMQREVDAALRETLGPDHLVVAATTVNVADALSNLGRADEAEPLYRRALAVREAALPATSFELARTRYKLVRCLGMNERTGAERRRLMALVTPVYDAALADDDWRKALAFTNRAMTSLYLRDYLDAASAARRAYELRRDGGLDATKYQEDLRILGLASLHAARFADAIEPFSIMIGSYSDGGTISDQGLDDRLCLVAAHLHLGHLDEAGTLIGDAIALMPEGHARRAAWLAMSAAVADGAVEGALAVERDRLRTLPGAPRADGGA